MSDFDHILNWELKKGSHEFPGPAGGTCINEAAIVAAGFEYKSVNSWRDCPPCFCPVLSGFAIVVNDHLDNADRNRLLMPLVTRLAGSAGERRVQTARIRFILQSLDDEFVVQGTKALVPRALMHASRANSTFPAIDNPYEMLRRAEAARADAYRNAAVEIEDALWALVASVSYFWEALLPFGRVEWFGDYKPVISPFVEPFSDHIPTFYGNRHSVTSREVWLKAAEILTRAFEIGPRAPELDTAKVVERMEAAKKAGSRKAEFA